MTCALKPTLTLMGLSGPMLRMHSLSQEADGAVSLVVMAEETKPLIDAMTDAAEWLARMSDHPQ